MNGKLTASLFVAGCAKSEDAQKKMAKTNVLLSMGVLRGGLNFKYPSIKISAGMPSIEFVALRPRECGIIAEWTKGPIFSDAIFRFTLLLIALGTAKGAQCRK